MRQIANSLLWVGNSGDGANIRALFACSLKAVVDLALEEPPKVLPRELAYLRLPLIDGEGNPPWTIRAAISQTADLIRDRVPTLICCSMGMSRAPCIAAAALAYAQGGSGEDGLARVSDSGPADVAPGFWSEVLEVLKSMQPVGRVSV